MRITPAYSSFFSCLYDEPEPVGNLGRGAHYSIFRSTEWLNVVREPLPLPEVHDFAVIWDDDHDTRVIPLIERIYMAGLLSPVQFIGERKGTVTVLVAAKYYMHGDESVIKEYTRKLNAISQEMGDDIWPVEVGRFDRSNVHGCHHQCEPHSLIMADQDQVITYLKTIDSLWALGTKPYTRGRVVVPWDTRNHPLFWPANSV